MSGKTYPRHLYLPPAGRPRWLPRDPDAWDLLYLSWGRRWFRDNPIPIAMHDGWVYVAVLDGAPQLVTDSGTQRIRAGSVIVVHPDCAYGWTDQPRHSCRILAWLWRSAPALATLQPPAGGFLCLKLDRAAMRRLAALHANSVREVATPDEAAVLSLHCARLELDIILARAGNRPPAVDSRYRMKLALEFLRNNLAERQPVQRLCEYLQVTPAVLNTLFRQHSGESVKRFLLRWRMQVARAKLRDEHLPAKQVAFELGYRHANDFSRAFKRFFGVTTRGLMKPRAGRRKVAPATSRKTC
jgi:AraC-like DNA-binding protein